MGQKAGLRWFIAAVGICTMGSAACMSGKIISAQQTTSTAELGLSPNGAVPKGGPVGPACGYKNSGKLVHVAQDVDVCLPPTSCTAEVCPPPLGTCVEGNCVMKAGYAGVQTLPQAWATHYCQLSNGGCNGVTQVEKVELTAQKLATQLSLPLCEGAAAGADCIGIAASSPLMVGNSQNAVDAMTQLPVRPWGLGLSEASNICYHIKGPGGAAYVALTDRCGGYCKCNGSSYQECGACVNAADMTPNCPCVGTAPGVADACCGAGPGCSALAPACDWCATNNHPHFDVDEATFNHICGEQKVAGSCQLTLVAPIACPLGVSWPPP